MMNLQWIRLPKLKIQQWFFRTFITISAFFLLVALVCFIHIYDLQYIFDNVSENERQVQRSLRQMQYSVLDWMRGVNTYLVSNEATDEAFFRESHKQLLVVLSKYEQGELFDHVGLNVEEVVEHQVRASEVVEKLVSLHRGLLETLAWFRREANDLYLLIVAEENSLDINDPLYFEKNTRYSSLEKSVSLVQLAVEKYLLHANQKFYDDIYDAERNFQSLLEGIRKLQQEAVVSEWQNSIQNRFSVFVQKGFALIKMREQEMDFQKEFRDTSFELLFTLRYRVDKLVDNRNYIVSKRIERKMFYLLLTFLLCSLLMVLLGIFLYMVIRRVVTGPVFQLTDVSRGISKLRDFTRRVDVEEKACVEINELAESFNQMLDAINEKEQLLTNSVENMTDGFILCQVDTVFRKAIIMDWNSHAAKMFGFSREAVVGKALADVLPWVQERGVLSHCWYVFEHSESCVLNKIPFMKNDVEKFMEVTIYSVEQGFVLLCRDITEKLMVEQHLLHSEKLVATGEISAGLAHEIGNPLTAVDSIIQILKKQEEDPVKRQDLEVASENIARMKNTLQNLVDFARLPKQDVTVFDVRDMVKKSLQLIRHHQKLRLMDISQDFGEKPLKISADEKQMEQVVINLVINAADAILEAFDKVDREKGCIAIQTVRKGDKVVLSIKDNGVGLLPNDVQRVFEPFFSTKKNVEGSGTGLGLTLVRNSVERFGGSVEIHSERLVGTTVSLSLPLV